MKATGSDEGNGFLGIQWGVDYQTHEGLRKQVGGQGSRCPAEIWVSSCRERTMSTIIHYDGSSSAIRCFLLSGRRGPCGLRRGAILEAFNELEYVAGCSDLPGNPPQ